MNKRFVLLMAAISFFASLGLISETITGQNQAGTASPTATPAEESSSLLYLDKIELKIPAPPGYGCREKCDEDRIINVIARGINVEEKRNVYKYTISGGRVLDEGKNVRWDLSGAKPGTYTITVSVADSEKTKEETQTVVVRDCDCFFDCFCPTISVARSRFVNMGENITFLAEVSGSTATDVEFDWTVSQAEIIEGQGTPEITVKPGREKTGSVKVTVKFSSAGLCAGCPRTMTETVEITK